MGETAAGMQHPSGALRSSPPQILSARTPPVVSRCLLFRLHTFERRCAVVEADRGPDDSSVAICVCCRLHAVSVLLKICGVMASGVRTVWCERACFRGLLPHDVLLHAPV
jgi:hypothetical protein